ncbi:hypothetical protein Taro_046289 [Colocasia esculenta]|uniref:CCHC-type domain-containing protein n=1 Tax=Colocasia esculenta TaxID=4460 RepID=A0A843WYW8_COLES|nr:hypothetical protein [Colocasia esculenta]
MVPSSDRPECVHCGKRHGAIVCWLKEGRCLKCGSKGQQIRECPRLKKLVLRGVPATVATKLATPAKENVLARDGINDDTRGETGVPMLEEGTTRSVIEREK